MLHLRIVAPVDASAAVQALLTDDPGVAHLAVLPGAARQPVGDLILCDVVRESADRVLRQLQELGIEARGGISADDVELTLSAAARKAAREAPGGWGATPPGRIGTTTTRPSSSRRTRTTAP